MVGVFLALDEPFICAETEQVLFQAAHHVLELEQISKGGIKLLASGNAVEQENIFRKNIHSLVAFLIIWLDT